MSHVAMQIMKSKIPVLSVAVLAFLGFADSAYLAAERFLRLPLPCATGGGCETVLLSPHAFIGPIPISFLGVVYYLIVLILAVQLYTSGSENSKIPQLLFWLTAAGFLSSVYFVYLQIAVIHALCMYCLGSAGISTLLLIASLVLISQIDSVQ